jgi:hypothetical protein
MAIDRAAAVSLRAALLIAFAALVTYALIAR